MTKPSTPHATRIVVPPDADETEKLFRKQVILTSEQLAKVTAWADKLRLNKNEVIRRMIDKAKWPEE